MVEKCFFLKPYISLIFFIDNGGYSKWGSGGGQGRGWGYRGKYASLVLLQLLILIEVLVSNTYSNMVTEI